MWPTAKPGMLAVVKILGDSFGDFAPVSTRLPATNMPARFIKVTRIGGRREDQATDRIRVLVECFSRDYYHCEPMCAQAEAALRNAAGTTVYPIQQMASGPVVIDIFVRGVDSQSGPVDRPHPEIVDRSRWEFQCDVLVKANDPAGETTQYTTA